MIYRFEHFELDTARIELRSNGCAKAVEPQVFALLRFLVENRDRMVTRDEIVEHVWNGRFVSDAAVSSRIKSVRQAIGDDGRSQRVIRTVHGMGFRFVADVATETDTAPASAPASSPASQSQPDPVDAFASRPGIAVLPFRLVGIAGPMFAVAEALPQDLITELSRLRWLMVIARASSFRFRGSEDIEQVRSALNVRYCLSGSIELFDAAMAVSVELCDTSDRSILWSEKFQGGLGAVHEIRAEIVRSAIAALELQIPLNEARAARLRSPDKLDAWSAYHLALHHMYRFNKEDNARATALLQHATALEPEFARAYAGLSFTHFQNAFLSYSDDISASRGLARRYAEQCLERDPVDPFGNFTMGRAHWLTGDLEGSLPWLERANSLNPNYAQARYARAWAEALLGNTKEGETDVDAALALSPLDPLRYGMLGVRSFVYTGRGETGKAADWAEQAAKSPGAHVLIEMMAVAAHAMNSDTDRAAAWAASVRKRSPQFGVAEYFRAFPLRDPATRKRVADALASHGF
ncbi:MAG: transcriptional regulator [Alphaproteobacteria bacterium]|nr:transcriptional regulator [Alphaproteobacteria bacterium]